MTNNHVMKKEIEIERKFLLKRMPVLPYEGKKVISQCYVKEGDQMVRYRGVSHAGELKYIRMIKTALEPGVNQEEFEDISQEEFVKVHGVSNKKITKNRHLYTDKDTGLTWEVDQYTFLDMVVAEVELPEKGMEVSIPKEIEDVLVMEVTEHREFSNQSLADNFESM